MIESIRALEVRHLINANRLIEGIDHDISSEYHDVGSCRKLIFAMLENVRDLTWRQHPKRCVCCGEVREASERDACGQCGSKMDGPCE